MALNTGGLVTWFAGGLLAGALASVGALIGGLFFGPLLPGHTANWLGSALAIALSAVSLLIGTRVAAAPHHLGR